MLEGITWTDLFIDGAKYAAFIAIPVSIIIALLAQETRSWLIRYWAALPFVIAIGMAILEMITGSSIPLLGLGLLIFFAPAWGLLAFATYFAVVRLIGPSGSDDRL